MLSRSFIGTFTRAALRAGVRQVIAIEPAPDNVECLRRNFRREIESGRVIVSAKGVWYREDVLVLKVAEASALDSFMWKVPGGHEGPHVPLTTIDHLVSELRLDRVDFIKMDIEGAERQALAGARDTLTRFHPRLAIAAYHVPGDTEAIPRVVGSRYRAEAHCGIIRDQTGPEIRPEILLLQ